MQNENAKRFTVDKCIHCVLKSDSYEESLNINLWTDYCYSITRISEFVHVLSCVTWKLIVFIPTFVMIGQIKLILGLLRYTFKNCPASFLTRLYETINT